METKFQGFKRRFSTEMVLTIVTGASLILATTMAGFVVTDNLKLHESTQGVCFGVDGIDGAPGANGINGATGPNGAAGEAGASASPGVNGEMGAPGTPGASGSPGAAGTPGASGAPGINGTPGATGSPGSNGTPGPRGSTGATGATGATGTCDMSGDLIPAKDNEFSLGTADLRWKSIQLGPGTIWMQDVSDPDKQVGMTIDQGSLLLDGAAALQIGNIRITSTGMKAIDPSSNITIGDKGDSGYLAPANGIEFPDGSIQTTANTGNIPPGYSEYKMCIASPQNYVLFGTCEENRTHGRDIVMMSAG